MLKTMAQLIDPVPSNNSGLICCCYINGTGKIQVARVTNIPNWYFERVVFPGQRLLFESMPEGQLEIHTGMMASAILSDTIPCTRLQISEEDIVETPYTPEDEQRREVKNESAPTVPVTLRSPEPLKFELQSRESMRLPVGQVSLMRY
jgi:Domain of unknown function (DUF1830)